MARRLLLVRLVLIGFLGCSVYFPLTHDCYLNTVSCLGPGPGRTADLVAANRLERSPAFGAMASTHTSPDADGFCLACLWSQHMLQYRIITGLETPESVCLAGMTLRSARVRPAEIFDSATRRGPPVYFS
jgi:hypothetical protein